MSFESVIEKKQGQFLPLANDLTLFLDCIAILKNKDIAEGVFAAHDKSYVFLLPRSVRADLCDVYPEQSIETGLILGLLIAGHSYSHSHSGLDGLQVELFHVLPDVPCLGQYCWQRFAEKAQCTLIPFRLRLSEHASFAHCNAFDACTCRTELIERLRILQFEHAENYANEWEKYHRYASSLFSSTSSSSAPASTDVHPVYGSYQKGFRALASGIADGYNYEIDERARFHNVDSGHISEPWSCSRYTLISVDKAPKPIQVDSAVLLSFFPVPEVEHIDAQRNNNHLDNLRYPCQTVPMKKHKSSTSLSSPSSPSSNPSSSPSPSHSSKPSPNNSSQKSASRSLSFSKCARQDCTATRLFDNARCEEHKKELERRRMQLIQKWQTTART